MAVKVKEGVAGLEVGARVACTESLSDPERRKLGETPCRHQQKQRPLQGGGRNVRLEVGLPDGQEKLHPRLHPMETDVPVVLYANHLHMSLGDRERLRNERQERLEQSRNKHLLAHSSKHHAHCTLQRGVGYHDDVDGNDPVTCLQGRGRD